MVFLGGATKQTRETLTCTDTLRKALVSYRQRGMGGGRAVDAHPAHTLGASAEAAQAASAAAPSSGAARSQAPGAAAAVRRADIAAPSTSERRQALPEAAIAAPD